MNIYRINFDVSLDYIAFDNRKEKHIIPIADRELIQAVQQIDQLSKASPKLPNYQ